MKTEEIKYVLRNILRKKKQSFFSILCIVISTSMILGNIAMNNGLQHKLKEGINEAISGQLTLYSTTGSKINILESQLKEQQPFLLTGEEVKKISDIDENLLINKRIRFGSLLSHEEETTYSNLHGLEVSHINRIQNLITLKEGVMPETGACILISETVADELKCTIGDTLLLVATNIHDYMSDETATVCGIFEEKGLAIFLNYNAFIPYELGKEMVQLEDDYCLELIINTKNTGEIPSGTISQIESLIKDSPEEIQLSTWEHTIPLFYKIVQVWKGGGYFTQIIFVTFSLLILINLTTLIIHSRKKEFGTLLAIGFSWRKISGMLLAEYLIITLFALLVGYGLTLLQISWIDYTGIYISSKDMQSAFMTEYLLPILQVKDLAYISLLFCLTTCLAVFISICRIKGINPISLINNK